MADSPVQGERFQLTHNDFKNHHREIKTHGIINAGLKKRTLESGRIYRVSMQRSITDNTWGVKKKKFKFII